MKFLLVIPLLAIFLSNIPFKVEIKLPEVAKGAGCSDKQQARMQCRMETGKEVKQECCKKESTCICFVGFQVLAQAQPLSKFNFSITVEEPVNGLYCPVNWINPFIDSPLQPPDVV